MSDVYIVEACRSAIGKRGKGLAGLKPADLLGLVQKAALNRAKITPENIDQDSWSKRFQSHPTWLAFEGEDLAGFINLEETGHVDMLFVSPDYQRQRVAQKLYDVAQEQARSDGQKLMTVEASLGARGFFEKQGFSVLTEQKIERSGQILINFKMEKQLIQKKTFDCEKDFLMAKLSKSFFFKIPEAND